MGGGDSYFVIGAVLRPAQQVGHSASDSRDRGSQSATAAYIRRARRIGLSAEVDGGDLAAAVAELGADGQPRGAVLGALRGG